MKTIKNTRLNLDQIKDLCDKEGVLRDVTFSGCTLDFTGTVAAAYYEVVGDQFRLGGVPAKDITFVGHENVLTGIPH